MSKSKLNRVAFTDGLCSIYTAEGRSLKTKLGDFYFKEETIGIRSFTEFQAIGVEVNKVISIPFNDLVDIGRVVVIRGEYYLVNLIQRKDTFPMSLKLTLSKNNLRWQDDTIQKD